jgi:Tfp pilus assembly protein PilN
MIRVNLLGLPRPKKHRAPVVTMEGWGSLVVLAVVLLVVVGVQFLRYNRLQDEDKRLTKRVQDEQAEKVRLEGIRTDYDKFSKQKDLLTKRINIIEGLKAKQSGPSRLLTMLSSTVSNTDSLWLTSFEQSGQKITIEGVALNAKVVADFLTHLKDSKAFSDVDLKETSQETTPAGQISRFTFTVNGQLASTTPTT